MKLGKIIRRVWDLLKETIREFIDDQAFRLAAAISYYTIFSLPGVLLIIIVLAGFFFGQDAVQGQIHTQFGELVGPDTAYYIESLILNIHASSGTVISTVIGIATLVFGATAVFYQLQSSLNTIWNVKLKRNASFWFIIKARLLSFGMVLTIGFLMLVFLVVDAAIAFIGRLLNRLPIDQLTVVIVQLLNIVIPLFIITVLFALMYKVLPDVRIRWRDVWVGALVTAILFSLGKFAIGIYLGTVDVGSAYGAAGSLVVLLTWIFYSSLIFILGAEFTQVYARNFGHRIQPEDYAENIHPFNNEEKSNPV